ncbi:MAG TPA: nuclear transport factor 2 family protein [Streptosporangiaceae bacterium]|nr:nuclear transport factor 2 family protein [Streptosporangiaceae bacterium]
MVTSDPATFADMLSREQAAEAAMILGDPEPFKALWSRGNDISLFGAFGPCKKGWHQISKTMDWVASRYREGAVTDEYEVVHEGADLAYTVGYEIADVVLDGAPMARQRLRVTQIYRREDGEWHLVHRHGDFAPADQSPP